MKTALDSSVILDVITDDPEWAGASEIAVKKAASLGSLSIGECTLAEITPAFHQDDLEKFLSDWGIIYIPSSKECAILAGEMYRRYLQRQDRVGKKKSVLPDFLIGAHALHNGGRLLARDRGYYRDYFSKLSVIEP